MAICLRTIDSVEVVLMHDPDADTTGPRVGEHWLRAEAQPAGATRFRVRALSTTEYINVISAADGGERIAQLLVGLIAIDGEDVVGPDGEKKIDVDGLPARARAELANLAMKICEGAIGPLGE